MSAWRDKDGTRVFWRRRKRSGKESERRERLVRLMRWTRHEIAPVLIALVIAWLIGAIGIHFAERGTNENYRTWGESFWNVWVMMFSGVDNPPRTPIGRLLTVIVVGIGIGLVGLFTGGVASTLVVRRLGRREVSQFEMEDHLVLCNWASRGLEWIQEVHNKFIQDKRSVVVIHDNPEAIDLPSKQDDPVFNDVYIVKGDPTSEIILRRARVQHAHSVVVLSDDRQGEHADGKTILICIAAPQPLQIKQEREHRRRVPQSRQPASPEASRRRRDHFVGRAGTAAAGPHVALSRHDSRLSRTAHRRQGRQRDVSARVAAGALVRPRFSWRSRACSCGTATTVGLAF